MLQRTDFYPSKKQKAVALNQQSGERQSHLLCFSEAYFGFQCMEKTCFITVIVYQSNFNTATTGFMV